MIRRVALVVAGSLLVGAGPAWAGAWGDASTVTTGELSTARVATPANFECSWLGLLAVEFSWEPVPGASGYVLHYGGHSRDTTQTWVTDVELLAAGSAWVEAYRSFGDNRWFSAPSATREYTVLLGIAMCG